MPGNGLVPITTNKDSSPLDFINIISYKCLKGCMTATCSCRKAVICVSCKGLSCSNSDININEEKYDDPTDEMLEIFLVPEDITHEADYR